MSEPGEHELSRGAGTGMKTCPKCRYPNPDHLNECFKCKTVLSAFNVEHPPIGATQAAEAQTSHSGAHFPPQHSVSFVPAAINRPITSIGLVILEVLLAIVLIVIGIVSVIPTGLKRENADETAIASVRAIGSALKVGVNLLTYSNMLIDAQVKIDAYTLKHRDDKLRAKLEAVQQKYVDAGRIWRYEGESDYESVIEGLQVRLELTKRYPTYKGGLDGDFRQFLWGLASEAAELL